MELTYKGATYPEDSTYEQLIDAYEVPQSVVDDHFRLVRLADALAKVDDFHAQVLRDLTGGATVEERDTWKVKEDAARALIAGSATAGQQSMLALEGKGDDSTAEEIAAIVIAKADAFLTLIGTAAGLRRKARNAVKAAADGAAQYDDVDAAVSTVLTTFKMEADAAIEAFKTAG